MFKRLFAFLFGARRGSKAGPDPTYYPVVGSSASDRADATAPWRAQQQHAPGPDATVLALPPDHAPARSRAAQPTAGEAGEAGQRLAWPARDLSRSRPVSPPPPDDATVLVARDRPPSRPPPPPSAPVDGDATILVTTRGRPRPPTS